MQGGARGPHARRTLCTLSVRPRAPTQQMGLFQQPSRSMTPSREMPGFRGLSHLTRAGDARMVDVSAKAETIREAVARATLKMRAATLAAIRAGQLAKGDVLGVARTAGILAAKRSTVTVRARVRTVDKTGVEMEALTAAAVAGLTVYDMVKAVDRGVVLTDLRLMEKSGGKSGHWRRR